MLQFIKFTPAALALGICLARAAPSPAPPLSPLPLDDQCPECEVSLTLHTTGDCTCLSISIANPMTTEGGCDCNTGIGECQVVESRPCTATGTLVVGSCPPPMTGSALPFSLSAQCSIDDEKALCGGSAHAVAKLDCEPCFPDECQ